MHFAWPVRFFLEYPRIHRLLQIVEGTQLDGRHGTLYLGIAGHHDDLYVGTFVLYPGQQHDTVAVGEPQVGQGDAEILPQYLFLGQLHRHAVRGFVTVFLCPVRYGQAVCGVVFYNKYLVHGE